MPSSAPATGRLESKGLFERAQNSVQITEPERDQEWEVISNAS